jgi:hypothetical protein
MTVSCRRGAMDAPDTAMNAKIVVGEKLAASFSMCFIHGGET